MDRIGPWIQWHLQVPIAAQTWPRARSGDAVQTAAFRRASRRDAVRKGFHMSTIKVSPAATAATPPPDGTPDPATAQSPTVTHYQQLADDFTKALDQIASSIPKLEATHPATANFVRSHVNVPTEFLATAIAAVEQTPELQAVNKFDVVAARDALQFIEAFRPVLDKMAALTDSLRFTISGRKATVAADALQIYAIAKGVARDPGATNAHSHVQNLKRDLGRSGKTRVAKQPAPPFNAARPEEGKPA